jgi:predicted flap endonuclease-1-like 5' DNA nuclease
MFSFLFGVVVGGIIVYFFWQNKAQDARSNERALQQRLTDAENENRRLLSEQAGSQRKDEQLDTYQTELQAKTEELQQTTAQLSSAEAQISTLREQLAAAEAKAEAATDRAIAEAGEEVASPVQPDDLKKIEGIGPKVAQVLNESGILTFVQLAQTNVSKLRAILEEAGPRFKMMDPESWPEQAGLAGKGDWDALGKLQDELDGGKYRKP